MAELERRNGGMSVWLWSMSSSTGETMRGGCDGLAKNIEEAEHVDGHGGLGAKWWPHGRKAWRQ